MPAQGAKVGKNKRTYAKKAAYSPFFAYIFYS